MTEPTAAAAAEEPSIEEILASIRKIISDEPSPAETAAQAALTESHMEALEEEEDVLDLSAFVAQTPADLELDLTDGNSAPADTFDSIPKHLETAAARPQPIMADPGDTGIASPATVNAAAAAMAKLQRAAEPSYPSTTQLWVGARTIEQLVEDLMRPILKTWLDQNLPKLVERLVEKELARMSKRVGD